MFHHGILMLTATAGTRNQITEPGDVNGILTRDGWGEDKIAMLWNIDFLHQNLLRQPVMQVAACLPYTDYSGCSPVLQIQRKQRKPLYEWRK